MAKKYQNSLLSKPVIKDKSLLRHEEIKKSINIIPELESLIPPLKAAEYEQLESNILKEGCREALLVWQRPDASYYLIDGHNRYSICKKHGLDFRVNLMEFADLDEAKAFMVENQLGRRNLTPEQASYLRGVRYNQEKKGRGEYNREQMTQNGPNATKPTSERLAAEYSVSKNTIKRDAAFSIGLDRIGEQNPQLKRDILAGNIKLKKTEVQQLASVPKLPQLSTEMELQRFLGKLSAPVKAPTSKVGKRVAPPLDNRLKEARADLLKLQAAFQANKQEEVEILCDALIQTLQSIKGSN